MVARVPPKKISIERLLSFDVKKTGDPWSPLRVRSFYGEAGGVEDNVAGDPWSPLQKVIVFFLRVRFCGGDDRLHPPRQTFIFGWGHRLFA